MLLQNSLHGVKNPLVMQETLGWGGGEVGEGFKSLSWKDHLEEGRATDSSVLAWRIPWTCCSKGDPFQDPKLDSSLNTQRLIVQGDTSANKARDFIGKGHPGGEQ